MRKVAAEKDRNIALDAVRQIVREELAPYDGVASRPMLAARGIARGTRIRGLREKKDRL